VIAIGNEKVVTTLPYAGVTDTISGRQLIAIGIATSPWSTHVQTIHRSTRARIDAHLRHSVVTS
jgi:hypothetical protein